MIKDNQFLKGKAKSFASKKQKNTVETNILCVYRIKKKNVWYLQKKSRREARKHVSFLCSISLGHRERERERQADHNSPEEQDFDSPYYIFKLF